MRRCGTIGLVVLMVVLVGGGSAFAQQDPYSGGTATNASACAASHLKITVDRTQGLYVGDPLTASMSGYPPGTPINVTFDGLPFGRGTADSAGNSEVKGSVPDLPLGEYFVCSSAAGCDTACVDPGLEVLGRRPTKVLGVQFQNNDSGSGSTGGSVLAHTGVDIALLALLGLILVLTGLWLRRRRRSGATT